METINKQQVTIDLKKPNVLSTPQFIQQDSNIIDFKVKDNGVDADLSNISRVVINYKRPDGVVISRLLQPSGNIVSYTIGLAEMEVPGQGELEVQFFSEGDAKRISTRRFKVKFSEEIGTDEIQNNDEALTVLQALFVEVDDFYQQTTVYEQERQTNETARIDAENLRQTNETARQQTVADLTNLHDSVSAAVTSANNLVTTGQPIVDNAQTQGTYAQTQGDYAKTQGDYAKAQGDLITEIMNDGQVASVNGKTGIVELTAGDVGAIPSTEKGTANGVAKLNEAGKVIDAAGNVVESFSKDYNELNNKPTIPTIQDASTTVKGIVQLSDSTTSTSTVLAATANAVKLTMDRANEAFQSASDGKTLLETSIEAKGGTVSKAGAVATYAELATGIESIPTGGAGLKMKSGTATSDSNGHIDITGLDFDPLIAFAFKSGIKTMMMENSSIYIHSDLSGVYEQSAKINVNRTVYNATGSAHGIGYASIDVIEANTQYNYCVIG